MSFDQKSIKEALCFDEQIIFYHSVSSVFALLFRTHCATAVLINFTYINVIAKFLKIGFQ